MNAGPFFDTNIILYAFRKDDVRSQVAEKLLAAGGTISVQVLNEFVAVARRKLDKNWKEIRRALDILRVFCPEPIALSVEIHDRGLDIAERYGYSIFDALVISAAIHSGAGTLYSEDMRDGQTIEGLTIRNPFKRLKAFSGPDSRLSAGKKGMVQGEKWRGHHGVFPLVHGAGDGALRRRKRAGPARFDDWVDKGKRRTRWWPAVW